MFYSQRLTKQQTENLCVRCETKFDRWSTYHQHVLSNDCKLAIKPLNTSGRSKEEIVKSWESQQKQGAIIR